MASYLTTASMGEFELDAYQANGIRFWDAVDPDLYVPVQPRTGSQYAISQKSEPSYKRLQRTIPVPSGGATMTFWVNRNTEGNWDYLFVEAHTAGMDNWTTLPDANGHTSQDTGFVCPFWVFELHPFLDHYQTPNDEGGCDPTGTTGAWHAVSGLSDGWEQWSVNLGAFAGSTAEVSISYASDDLFQLPGVFVDDIVVSTGAGTTSFENDGDTMDGWTVPGAPAGSAAEPERLDRRHARRRPAADRRADRRDVRAPARDHRVRGGLLRRLPVPGGRRHRRRRQRARVRAREPDPADLREDFFVDQTSAEDVVVHELAHQWYGDSLTVAQWQNIWLNEGFATYAEWL